MSDRAQRRARRRPRGAPAGAPVDASDRVVDGADEATPDEGPTPLRVAVLILWLEAALVGVLAVFDLVNLLAGDADRVSTGVWLVVALAAAAAALWFAARLLVRRRTAGQGLAISLQLAAVPVAFYMGSGDSGFWVAVGGVAIGAAAVTVIALLLAPSTRHALPRR